MRLIVDHKKFGCKTIFQDWSGDEEQDDKISKTQSGVQLSADSYQEHHEPHQQFQHHEQPSLNGTYENIYTNIESASKPDSNGQLPTNRQFVNPPSINHHHVEHEQYSTHHHYNHYNQPSTNPTNPTNLNQSHPPHNERMRAPTTFLRSNESFNHFPMVEIEQLPTNSSHQPSNVNDVNHHYEDYEQIYTKHQFSQTSTNRTNGQHFINHDREPILTNNGQYTTIIQHTSMNSQIPQNEMPFINNNHNGQLSTNPIREDKFVANRDSFSMNSILEQSSTIPDYDKSSHGHYLTDLMHNQPNHNYDQFSTTHLARNPQNELSSADSCMDHATTIRHNDHLSTIHPCKQPTANRRHECETCGRVFDTNSKLKIHENCHAKSKTFVCDICQKSFFTFNHLKNHMRKHDGRTPFKCDYCRKFFTTETGLSTHLKRHVGKQIQRCTTCDKTFPAPYHLKKHMIKHTKEKRFECNICQKRFSRQGSLHVHQRLHSSASPRYQCDLCPKRFHWQSNLKAHRPTHFDGCTRCDICKRKFDSYEELELHGTFHSSNVQFQCVWCEKCYTSRHKLHYHIKNSHVKLPTYQCEECDKSFKFLQQLKIHRIVHTDKKPRCYVCNKTFLTKYNLQSHLTSHVSTKSFQCDICAIKFTYKRNLYIHLKRHAQAREQNPTDFQNQLKERRKKMKKLKCGTCDREFAYQKSLEKCDHKSLLMNFVKPTKILSKSKNVGSVSEHGDCSSMNTIVQYNTIQMQNDRHGQEHNNIKVQVNIMLGDSEQPLWELNLPSARAEEAKKADKRLSSPLNDNRSSSPVIEKRTITCDVTESGDYYYFPAYLNTCLGSNEPIDFSMGYSPSAATNYSPFTAIPVDEPLDYSFHNVRLINNVTYREL